MSTTTSVATRVNDIHILARTAWGEARGGGKAGMAHVIMVAMNRVRHPTWWGHDVSSVCLAPWQFSCWNVDDPNRTKLLAVTPSDPQFAMALTLAERAIDGQLPDETGGADSYYALTLKPPYWTARAQHTTNDNWHSFWIVRSAPEKQSDAAPGVIVDPDAPTQRAALTTDELNERSAQGGSFPVI